MNIFSFIKANISIQDVVAEYTTLKRAGNYLKGPCPFHQERTASFTISPAKEIFYCFGCHAGGDVILFISKIENCSQFEAAKLISEKYSLAIPEEFIKANNYEKHEKNSALEKSYRNCHEIVASWCHQNLYNFKIAHEYVLSRDINEKTISKFKVGYFPAGAQAIKSLLDYAKDKGILAQDLIQAHILLESKNSSNISHNLYSPFEDRIIFPIKDHLGRFCAFGGRVFKKEDARAKYYNSHDHEYFNKGSVLFGLDIAKKIIQQKEAVFVVEGYMDAIMMVQYGFENTVATLGTACTHEHLKQLSRYAPKLFILYDGDNAGQKAIIRLTKLCWEFNIDLFVVILPKEDDPASYLSKQKNLQELIDKAQDIFLFFIESLSSDFKSKNLNEKMGLMQELLETISLIPDPVKMDILLKKASATFDIPFETLKSQLAKNNKKWAPQENNIINTKKNISSLKTESESVILENKLFYAIINSDSEIKKEDVDYLINNLSEPIKEIFLKFQTFKQDNKNGDFSSFFAILNEGEKEAVTKIIFKYEAAGQEFSEVFLQYQKKQWKSLVNGIMDEIAQAKSRGQSQEVIRILSEFQVLKEKMLRRGLI